MILNILRLSCGKVSPKNFCLKEIQNFLYTLKQCHVLAQILQAIHVTSMRSKYDKKWCSMTFLGFQARGYSSGVKQCLQILVHSLTGIFGGKTIPL